MMIKINVGFIHPAPLKLIHYLVVEKICIDPAISKKVSARGLYRYQLPCEPIQLSKGFQTLIAFHTQCGKADGSFPVIMRKHIQNHHFTLAQSLFIDLPVNCRNHFGCVFSVHNTIGKNFSSINRNLKVPARKKFDLLGYIRQGFGSWISTWQPLNRFTYRYGFFIGIQKVYLVEVPIEILFPFKSDR